jgi:MFS family permease
VIWAGLAISGLGALLVPVTEIYSTITFGVFLVGLGWSAVFVAATAIIADTTAPQQRGRAIGVNDTMAAAFAISLPLLGGLIAQELGLMAVGVFGAALVLLPLPLLVRLRETSPGVFEERAAAVETG